MHPEQESSCGWRPRSCLDEANTSKYPDLTTWFCIYLKVFLTQQRLFATLVKFRPKNSLVGKWYAWWNDMIFPCVESSCFCDDLTLRFLWLVGICVGCLNDLKTAGHGSALQVHYTNLFAWHHRVYHTGVDVTQRPVSKHWYRSSMSGKDTRDAGRSVGLWRHGVGKAASYGNSSAQMVGIWQ